MNSKTQERKLKRYHVRKELVKTNLTGIIDIDTLMSMTTTELKALTKAIGKIKGLKKTLNSVYQIDQLNQLVASETESETSETSEPETEPEETTNAEVVEEEKEFLPKSEIQQLHVEVEVEDEETDMKALDEYYTEECKTFIDKKEEIITKTDEHITFLIDNNLNDLTYDSISENENFYRPKITKCLSIYIHNKLEISKFNKKINAYCAHDVYPKITDYLSYDNRLTFKNILNDNDFISFWYMIIETIRVIINPIEAESENTDILTPLIPVKLSEAESENTDKLTPPSYDLDLYNQIIKKYDPASLTVKEEFFKNESRFINNLIEEYKDIKTIRYYKKQIDMTEFDIYETTLNEVVEVELKIFKTEKPEYTINADNIDEYITKNNIYLNRKQSKKNKLEFININDILCNIKNNIEIEEKHRILIEKKYCKDESKKNQFLYYYNENF